MRWKEGKRSANVEDRRGQRGRKTMIGGVGGLIVALCVASCARFQHADYLEVRLVDMRLTEATLLETTGSFILRVENESPDALFLEGAVHKIYLNDRYIGKGLSSDPLEVPRFGTTTQRVTIHLSNFSMVRRLRTIIDEQRFEYRIDSVLYETVGDRSRRLFTESVGVLDLQDFEAAPGEQ